MNLTPRQLAFLEHELTQIIEADDRPSEDQAHASSVLGRVQAEIEHQEEQQLNDNPDELFA